MRLFMIRHADAAPGEPDELRKLSPEGRAHARALGVHPGYALGRDYEGLDDALLVCLTEKRTPADIDRLAEVLHEVAG